MSAKILKLIAICNRLRIAPKSMRAAVERELIEAAKDLADSVVTPATLPSDEVEQAIARHREVLKTEKDPAVISATVGKIRRLQGRLTSADFDSQATGQRDD